MSELTRVTTDEQGRVWLVTHLGPITLTPDEARELATRLRAAASEAEERAADQRFDVGHS